MLKYAFLAAALLLPVTAYADDLTPCNEVQSEEFMGWSTGNSGITIIDVGRVKKEPGGNICSVLMDTTRGTIKMTFTTRPSVNGGTLIQRVSVHVAN